MLVNKIRCCVWQILIWLILLCHYEETNSTTTDTVSQFSLCKLRVILSNPPACLHSAELSGRFPWTRFPHRINITANMSANRMVCCMHCRVDIQASRLHACLICEMTFPALCLNLSPRKKCATCSTPPPSRTSCQEFTSKVLCQWGQREGRLVQIV